MRNQDGEIEYADFSPRELREALSLIRADKYPKNFENLVAECRRRGIDTEEFEKPKSRATDQQSTSSGENPSSRIGARLLGFLITVSGVALFMLRYRDGVYYGRRGRDYTFGDDPIFMTIVFFLHGSIILAGLLGLVFGQEFYRSIARRNTDSN